MARRYNEGRVFKQPGSKYFYIQWNANGKTYRESTKSENKTVAKDMLRQKLEAASSGTVVELESRITVTELLVDYIKAKEIEGLKSLTELPAERSVLGSASGSHQGFKVEHPCHHRLRCRSQEGTGTGQSHHQGGVCDEASQ